MSIAHEEYGTKGQEIKKIEEYKRNEAEHTLLRFFVVQMKQGYVS
ncbi:hypothetical protein [Paenibacillus xylanexedens]|nr:hypothetical protein [Paenibacillus xylanexedens]